MASGQALRRIAPMVWDMLGLIWRKLLYGCQFTQCMPAPQAGTLLTVCRQIEDNADMDQLHAMEIFLAVADHGSLSEAGRALNISRALVSKRILQLEQSLQARLFHRSTRELSLTPQGRAYLEPCRACVTQAHAARLALQFSQQALQGELRLQAPSSFGSSWLAASLARFALRYPDLRCHLHLDDRLLDPIKHGFDLSLRVGGIPDSHGLQMRVLAPCTGLLCASPAYLHEFGEPQQPQELTQHRCLHFSHLSQGTSWQLHKEQEHCEVEISPHFSSNNGLVLHQAALAGLGIVYHVDFLAWQALQTGELRRVLGDWQLPLNQFTLLYPTHKKLSANLRALIDFLVAEFQAPLPWSISTA